MISEELASFVTTTGRTKLTTDLLSPEQQNHVILVSNRIKDYSVRAFWPF